MTSLVSQPIYNNSMKQTYYIYILANRRNGTLYVGSTSDLKRRVYEHKNKFQDGFTKRYNVTMLVHYEISDSRISAIHRERYIKNWTRKKKLQLIEDHNAEWKDLYLMF